VKALNVLSLFDGISCGMVALNRCQFEVKAYFASEIDPKAIKIAQKNHPNIIEIGDIRDISYRDGYLITPSQRFFIDHIDLICGGSPCTNFSSIGYAYGMTVGDIEITSLEQYLELKSQNVVFDGQSYLFWEYCRILNEVKPDYFLLENVVMAKKWETIITKALGVEPLRINSALLSAQNRPRLYWTNIQNVTVPLDKNVSLDDILCHIEDIKDVSYCLTVQRSFPRLIKKYGYIPEKFNAYNAAELKNKACALSRGSMITSSCATLLFTRNDNGIYFVKNKMINGTYPTRLADGRYSIRKLNLVEIERLQTLPDGYTFDSLLSDQKRTEMIGNGWTVDVISHILSFMGNKTDD
jgi:DNA (cytosine-5)-methyltransferase 3A